jgi:6-hydroxymethylpterin diphosphokinase MptE-like protein
MSGRVEAPNPDGDPASSGVRPVFRFLDINLESLRIPEDTRKAVRDAEPRGRVETMADGTPVIRLPEGRVGMPLPQSEVLTQLERIENHHVVVVFGLGTGQLARAVRAMYDVPVIIYEPDPGVLRTVLEYGPLDIGNIPIVSGVSDLTKLWRDFSARLIDVRVLTTPGYYSLYPSEVRVFIDAIPTLLQRTAISKATYQNRAKVWVEDIIANVELLTHSPPFLTLTGKYEGVPAFIIGAGPSLDKNIHLLSEAARKGIVFATNSGAVSLAKHGIEPQVICCIESIDASIKLKNLPFIDRVVRGFSLSAAPQTLRTGTGTLMPVHELIAQYSGPLEELTGYGGLPMSGSVSTIATSLARILGCSPIVLCGQDLAYSNGRTYATGTGYEDSTARADPKTGIIHLKWNEEMIRIHGEAQGAARDTEELRRVPAWGGEGEVDSGAGFAGIQSWFETTAELLRKMDSPIRLINASEGGVHIDGFSDIRLRDVLAELVDRDITAESITRDAREKWTPISVDTIIAWLEAHAEAARGVRREARRLRRYATHGARVTVSGKPSEVTRSYDRMERAEAALREAVVACPLVDAWAHRAVDVAMLNNMIASSDVEVGPHRAAVDANKKSARVALAVERSALELETALKTTAGRLAERRLT